MTSARVCVIISAVIVAVSVRQGNRKESAFLNNELHCDPKAGRTRGAYAMECTFEYFVSILVSDAYLSSLLNYMGMSDGAIGIISSLISFAFLFQLFALFAVKHIKNVKRACIIFHFSSQMFFLSLFLVPFMPFAKGVGDGVVILCILAAYFGNYLVTSMIFKWGMSYVDPKKRADFASTKEMISLICGMVFTLSIGFAVDAFAEAGNVEGGFIFIAGAILLSSLLDLICLLIMKKPRAEEPDRGSGDGSTVNTVVGLFKNRAFLCLLVVGALLFSAQYLTNSFMGIYKISETELAFTVGEAQLINIAGLLFRFAISKPIGRFSDKTSYATGLLVGAVMLCLCFFLNIFTSPDAKWMIIPYTLLFHGSAAATNQNFLNITFDYVENKHFVHASSIKSALAGLCGFGSTVLGGRLLSFVQASSNTFMGIEMRGQQLLSAISLVLSLTLVAFLLLVMRKQKRIS